MVYYHATELSKVFEKKFSKLTQPKLGGTKLIMLPEVDPKWLGTKNSVGGGPFLESYF